MKNIIRNECLPQIIKNSTSILLHTHLHSLKTYPSKPEAFSFGKEKKNYKRKQIIINQCLAEKESALRISVLHLQVKESQRMNIFFILTKQEESLQHKLTHP